MSALPSLRMLLRPEPGFGLDARLPMGKQVRCFMSAEAYIHGGSTVSFGVEATKLPILRLQLAPTTQLSFRIPVRVSEFKYLVGGGAITLYKEGTRPQFKFGSGLGETWRGLRGFLGGVLEVQHRNSLLGSFLDAGQRKVLRDVVREVEMKREGRLSRRKLQRKDNAGKEGMPPLDPRKQVDVMEKLRRAMKEKYGDDGVVRGGEGVLKEELLKKMKAGGLVLPRTNDGLGERREGEGE